MFQSQRPQLMKIMNLKTRNIASKITIFKQMAILRKIRNNYLSQRDNLQIITNINKNRRSIWLVLVFQIFHSSFTLIIQCFVQCIVVARSQSVRKYNKYYLPCCCLPTYCHCSNHLMNPASIQSSLSLSLILNIYEFMNLAIAGSICIYICIWNIILRRAEELEELILNQQNSILSHVPLLLLLSQLLLLLHQIYEYGLYHYER